MEASRATQHRDEPKRSTQRDRIEIPHRPNLSGDEAIRGNTRRSAEQRAKANEPERSTENPSE